MAHTAPANTLDRGAQVDLRVTGMTCAACQANVQRALVRHAGVSAATVNLLTGQARVQFDPSMVRPAELTSAVETIGYGAEVASPEGSAVAEQEASEATHTRELWSLGLKATVSLIAGAVAMALSMPLMSMAVHGTGGAIDPVMRWTMDYAMAPAERVMPWLFTVPASTLRWSLLALTILVMGWPGRALYVTGIRALAHRVPDMNSLVAVGTGAAFLSSLVATVWPAFFTTAGVAADVYYEAVVIIIAFVLVGRALEAKARQETTAALRQLAALQPATATVVDGASERVVSIEDVDPGMVVLVRPGERVPVDGRVVDGTAMVDESMITGESMPVSKRPGGLVTGGTLNRSGAFRLEVTTVGPEATLAQIVRLMRDAQASRAPMQDLADRVSAVFVPTVLALSAATAGIWLLAGSDGGWVRALSAGVAVLTIACPCAMGLAVPTAIMVATGRAGRAGVLVKGGGALQRIGEVTIVVLDKTGTLTEGRPCVTQVVAVEGGEADVLALSAAVERLSEHPLAGAIVRAAAERRIPVPTASSFSSEPGRGATASVGSRRVHVGTADWLRAQGVPDEPLLREADRVAGDGDTPVLMAAIPEAASVRSPADGDASRSELPVLGVIGVADVVRPTSAAAVSALQSLGLDVVMLTGDRRATAHAMARQVGITHVIAEVRPEGKVDAIRTLQREGRVVAMVGDGTNDAPALAQADVGVAMGGGTDVALDAGQVALLRGDLGALAAAVRLSRATVRTMKQNLFWAFAYNVVGIPVAAGVLYPAFGVQLSPVLASVAMALSSLSVVANSLRLRTARI